MEPTKTHIHLFFEVLKYSGEIKNNEPHKHASVDFLTLDNAQIYPSVIEEVNAMLSGDNFIENSHLPFWKGVFYKKIKKVLAKAKKVWYKTVVFDVMGV